MTIIDNCVTKLFSYDKNESFAILTFFDFERELFPENIFDYANNLVNDNQILKQNIVKQNNIFSFKNIDNFDINNHIIIEYIEKEHFNNSINNILNNSFENKSFLLVCCIDKNKKFSRIYFKIDHAYADGYRIINMLTKPYIKNNTEYRLPDFKRKTTIFNTIYHYIIGTIVLLIMNIKIFFKLFFKVKQTKTYGDKNNDTITDFIMCKPFMLDKIKQFSSNNGITVNDFLYSLMIKTDKLYSRKNRIIQTVSPINVSKLSSTNNMCPILNSINNSLDNHTLIQQVHNTFDNFKYSLFIPFLTFIINHFLPHINIEIISFLYETVVYDCDYIYSNIIGPSVKEINKGSDLNLSNIHFLTKPKGNIIIFNIISSENNINIICSFNKGKIKDKKRFEKCIYRAYNSLINSDNGFN